jgi:hypothetical protein
MTRRPDRCGPGAETGVDPAGRPAGLGRAVDQARPVDLARRPGDLARAVDLVRLVDLVGRPVDLVR